MKLTEHDEFLDKFGIPESVLRVIVILFLVGRCFRALLRCFLTGFEA